jgi:hypothetical protein
VGLAGVPKSLVHRMGKKGKLPVRLKGAALDAELRKIGDIIERTADPDIFVWLDRDDPPTDLEINRAATIVADRLCGAVANPIVRNAQEKRQLAAIEAWLEARNYRQLFTASGATFDAMPPGTFSFRMNVPGTKEDGRSVNIPIDAVIKPKTSPPGDLPIFFEAKSAGDFTNVNKRRKEEADKVSNLRRQHGEQLRFVLFLCGYFDSGYLGYAAADSIDWVWEHRIDDLAGFGL